MRYQCLVIAERLVLVEEDGDLGIVGLAGRPLVGWESLAAAKRRASGLREAIAREIDAALADGTASSDIQQMGQSALAELVAQIGALREQRARDQDQIEERDRLLAGRDAEVRALEAELVNERKARAEVLLGLRTTHRALAEERYANAVLRRRLAELEALAVGRV